MLTALTWLLLVHCAATLFMTGLIWFVQVVHYPLFESVGRNGFAGYERAHQQRTGWVVGPTMLVELATAVTIAFTAGDTLAWLGLTLLIGIWASTALLQIPAHRTLARAFDGGAHRRLVGTNWIRTIAWTFRSVIALAML